MKSTGTYRGSNGVRPSTLVLGFIIISILGPVSGNEESESLFSSASCDFAVNLLKEKATSADDENVVLSPSSVSVLLSILQQGARENTSLQLRNALRMSAEESRNGHAKVFEHLRNKKESVTVEWGNRVYVKPGFALNDAFNDTIRDSFGASLEEIDFTKPSPREAANAINERIKEITRDAVKDLVPAYALDSNTTLLLLNAIYFKGKWNFPFATKSTKVDRFEPKPDGDVRVPFMSQRERFFAGEDPESGILWLDLPFKDPQYSMLFVLPIERHGLKNVLEKMNGSLLKKIMENKNTAEVSVIIPKFKIDQKVALEDDLKKLGLTDAFSKEADLGGIAANGSDFYVSKMLHRASVEIDESGTTATAVGVTIVRGVGGAPGETDHLVFNADHPFLFFILDRTDEIPLFAGKVADPS